MIATVSRDDTKRLAKAAFFEAAKLAVDAPMPPMALDRLWAQSKTKQLVDGL